jgi:hypothetical protein
MSDGFNEGSHYIYSSRQHHEIYGAHNSAVRNRLVFLASLLVLTSTCQVLAQTAKNHFKFVNVVDSTQGYSGFSQFPAINNRGSVAFIGSRSDGQGVLEWQDHKETTIASVADGRLSGFVVGVVINDAGVVGYHASPTTGVIDSEIFTSNGVRTRTIADANKQGFIGRFMGSPSINAARTVAFFSSRTTPSQAVLTGDGGALATVVDTSHSIFGQFGNAAINNSGEVVFLGVLKDKSAGVVIATPAEEPDDAKPVAPGPIETVIDSNNPIIYDPFIFFGDPAINEAGIVAEVAFLSNGNLEIFTGNASGAVARTDPNSPFFTFSEGPSINNRGAVAFFANGLSGSEGIFVELTGAASPIAVIEAGDSLLGATVIGLDLGRFALNDHDPLAFQYSLQDGRSGIAIASLQKGAREDCESER